MLLLLALPIPLAAYEPIDASRCPRLSLLDPDPSATCPEARLGDGDGNVEPAAESDQPAAQAAATTAKRYQLLTAGFVATSAVVGGAISALLEPPYQSFHFANDGFFGSTTYAGGADKASHFVDYAIVSKELAYLYEKMGYSRNDAILIGLGVSAATGLLNEVGDAFNKYGFSWEDLLMDLLGAGTASLIGAAGLQDLIGFRQGILAPAAPSQVCCQVDGLGHDYSNTIVTADLHLAGLARRLRLNVGPLRYLLLSGTYGTKGYPNGAPDRRERQVGVEIGLDFEVILDDLGVHRNTWWGYTLHVVFDNFRVPFTSIGFRYDLNSGRWIGPDNGNGYAR